MSDFEKTILDNNLKHTENAAISSDVSSSLNFSDSTDLNNDIENFEKNENIINIEDNESEKNSEESIENKTPEVNCLYLTVKKDYSLSIFKNKIKKAIKGSWRVAVSIFVLNFLASFF